MKRAIVFLAVAGGAFLIATWMTRAKAPAPQAAAVLPIDPVRPMEPPDPEHYVPPKAMPQPEPHPDSPRIAAEAWSRAIAENAERPGETAFRATVNAFVHHNRKFAEAQAEREGLTVEEVEELTYFGLMAQETQRFEEVEQLLGRPVAPDVRERAAALMFDLNREFKTAMRERVKAGASASERWALIRATEARYLTAYFELTGMNDGLLDDLLAGDASRAHAVAMSPEPEDQPQAEGEDPNAEVERPETPDESSP